ncbi:MAG TPA: PepSY domain-containing protein, partial [Geminicoccus sp.]|uniref:PepSY-associated TM helix domain-containing protein n=1 Tax=Geminicoccus sp. TaxID=2024832 RepID=UPI002E36E7D7
MGDIAFGARQATAQRPARAAIYRAVWRWHFYAGLIALPFLILLAVTGGLYLFHDELDGWFHRDLLTVEAQTSPALQPADLTSRALAAHPGTAYKYLPPANPKASAEVGIKSPSSEKFSVFLDPYDGRVLGTLGDQASVMWTVRQLHSLALFGTWPSYLIEIVGGWAIILVVTGFYLWWPRRRQSGGIVSLRGTSRQRVFWRDLHAVTGMVAGLFIGFLALTGMPWSTFWGDKSLAILTSMNQAFPAGAWGDTPTSAVQMQAAVD